MDTYVAEILCKRHMRDNGLDGWKFKWSSARTTLGTCNRGTKTIKLSRIFVSVNDQPTVLNIILHEIAHALTPGHKHDGVWRRKAIELGSDGRRCQDIADFEAAPAPYYLVCKNCDKKSPRYKRPKAGKWWACRACCAKYNGGRATSRFRLELWDADILNREMREVAATANWYEAIKVAHKHSERRAV